MSKENEQELNQESIQCPECPMGTLWRKNETTETGRSVYECDRCGGQWSVTIREERTGMNKRTGRQQEPSA